ncbi:MAG: GWxTD domain-containing protein [Candidatus Acidiferrales bacterium]
MRPATRIDTSRADCDSSVAGLSQPYLVWLTEDVSYIISPDECSAFLRLTNDEDRDTFIRQFWQRRNPDPDAQDNTFKSEHYRRIVYSNEHFSFGSTDGWKTDRGQIYIQWGQPDSVLSNEAGYGGASEIWRYRHLEEIGENVALQFADPRLTGEYRLTLEPDERSRLFQSAIPDNGTGETNCEECIRSLMELQTESRSKFNFRFKWLESAVVERADLADVRFSYHFDAVPATPFTTLIPMTIQIPTFEFGPQSGTSAQALRLNLFLRVADASGRVVETFEDWVPEVADEDEAQDSVAPYIIQKKITLRPGSYDVAIAIGNPESGEIGTAYAKLAVPQMTDHR